MVHIIKDLVFTDHAPDKGISFGSDTGMDRPARGDHRLLVMHHNMTRFLRLPHHVENAGVIIHIEIEINFHPALVGVTRHGVPQVQAKRSLQLGIVQRTVVDHRACAAHALFGGLEDPFDISLNLI